MWKNTIIMVLALILTGFAQYKLYLYIIAVFHENDHKFVVTDMVQCKGNICHAVLEMDDITILLPYDSTKVNVGDTLYLTK